MSRATDDLVPVIDLGPARDDPAARPRVAAAIDEACRTSGFFAVTGHGVDDAVIREAIGRSREFFALPFEEKSQVTSTEPWGFRGYLGVDATALAATGSSPCCTPRTSPASRSTTTASGTTSPTSRAGWS